MCGHVEKREVPLHVHLIRDSKSVRNELGADLQFFFNEMTFERDVIRSDITSSTLLTLLLNIAKQCNLWFISD